LGTTEKSMIVRRCRTISGKSDPDGSDYRESLWQAEKLGRKIPKTSFIRATGGVSPSAEP
jgi:hypothetical protein